MNVVLLAPGNGRGDAVRRAAAGWRNTVTDPGGARPDLTDATDVADVLRQLDDDLVDMAVLPASGDPDSACWTVVQRADKPVLLVPESFPSAGERLHTALLPLDGTPEAATAVARAVDLLSTAGVGLIVLHVFTGDTVPLYWDQGAHAQEVWEDEFRARYCAEPGARITLRSGRPGEHVLAVAREVGADLIALGWSQRLDAGRAATVRETVANADVPILLTPCVSASVGRKPL